MVVSGGIGAVLCRSHRKRRALASLPVKAAINFLKLLVEMPLQSMKQIEGCSEIQHLRNCGSCVCSNRGPARWYRPFNLSVWTVGPWLYRCKQSPQFLVHQEIIFMAMYINTNTSSLNAQRNLMNTNKSLDTSYKSPTVWLLRLMVWIRVTATPTMVSRSLRLPKGPWMK